MKVRWTTSSIGWRIAGALALAMMVVPLAVAVGLRIYYSWRAIARGIAWLLILAVFAVSWWLIFRSGPLTVLAAVAAMILRPTVVSREGTAP